MNNLMVWISIAVIALVTAALRFLPFLIFTKGKTPELIEKLSRTLPFAIMAMLVVYCLKNIHFTNLSGFLPELIACLVVGALHIWKRNTLLSILCGTICYMLLVQLVF